MSSRRVPRRARCCVGLESWCDDVRVDEPKEELHRYLQAGRNALMWKLDGLSDYDLRRPLTPSGTNLLGVVKHVASVEIEYFTRAFDRECPADLPWFAADAKPNADMWVPAEEHTADIIALYRFSWQTSDTTIRELDLESPGEVEWWPEHRRHTTLRGVLVHMIAETHRHAGHVDIVRELVDGARGWNEDALNLPKFDATDWAQHYDEIARSAESFKVS